MDGNTFDLFFLIVLLHLVTVNNGGAAGLTIFFLDGIQFVNDDLADALGLLEGVLQKPQRIRKIIIDELNAVKKKYGQPRRTTIIYSDEVEEYNEEEEIESVPVHLFLSRDGYFKKITPQSLRMSGEQKFKEGDELAVTVETVSTAELMFFTDRCQVYKARVDQFADSKASLLGDYLPGKLAMGLLWNLIPFRRFSILLSWQPGSPFPSNWGIPAIR